MASFFVNAAKEAILKQGNAMLDEMIPKCRKACVQATDEIRQKIILDWFGKYNSDDVIGALNNLEAYTWDVGKQHGKTNFHRTINVTTYIDINKYAPRPRAEAWRARHPEKKGESSNFYVLGKLQINQGIIGLPSWGDYIAIQKTPLKTVMLHSGLWSTFEQRVNSLIG